MGQAMGDCEEEAVVVYWPTRGRRWAGPVLEPNGNLKLSRVRRSVHHPASALFGTMRCHGSLGQWSRMSCDLFPANIHPGG